MKISKILFYIFLTLAITTTAQSHQACVQRVLNFVGQNQSIAETSCHGVKMECMEYLEKNNESSFEAALICRGGVSLSCIKTNQIQMNINARAAALTCQNSK